MPFDINTNIASLQAQQYLQKNSNFQNKTINEVTSGLRIVNAGDDAAGLAVANGYRSNEAVLTQGVQNANQGLSQLQIADGGISNISQLLDRARTLATESASGTFTGSRDVLNSEFQSVIGEINRQAEAIGLNQGGSFAQSLNVFIGGGQKSGTITAVQNGSVSVDLSKSTVDAQSLGLQGVQAIGAAGTDIGTGSPSTSVSSILANTTNTASEAIGGFTTFTFQGPGFGNNNPVNVSVNLTGVTDANTLVTALNTAIQNAGNGATQQATAFKNAGITASLNTDATGKTQLTFDSSNAAFQVSAGDRVSQALLGNFQQNAVLTGTDQNATVNTSVNNTLTLSINGVSLAPISVTSGATTSKAQLVRDLNGAAAFNAVATASLQGNELVITSKLNSSSSAVSASGALATALGLGSAAAASASTGASLNTQVQFNGPTAAGSTTFGAAGAGPVVFQFQGGGLTSPLNVTLNATASETVTQAIADLSSQVSNNATLKAAGISLTSSTAGNALVFSGSAGSAFNIAVTGDNQNLLGGGSFVAGAGNSFDYSTLTGANSYSGPSAVGTANIEFSINGAASHANAIAVDLGAGDATAATVTSSNTSAGTVAINPNNNTLNLVVNGTGVSVTLNNNAAATKADIANQITTALSGAGIAASASVVGNAITLTTTNKGAGQTIQVQAGTANTALGFSAGVSNGSARSGASIAAALNTAFAANSTLQAAGLTADFGVTAAGKITVTSSNGTFFRADAYGASGAATVVGSASANTAATAGTATGTTTSATYAITSGTNDTINVKVDGGASQAIVLTGGAARTAQQVVNDINNQITGATAFLDSGNHINIASNTTGASSTVQILAGNGDATLGLAVATSTGAAAVSGFTINGSNDQFTINENGAGAQTVTLTHGSGLSAATVAADIQAKLAALSTPINVTATAVNNTIQIASSTTGSGSSLVIGSGDANATLGFSAGTTNGTQADLGFGVAGAAFANGNTATAAPAVPVQLDSGGANQTGSLAFTGITDGNDTQTVSVSALDSSGVTHSLTTLLQNNAASRAGESLDSAINAINTALQQSNDSTLKSIVAVKENVAGVEKIGFLSSTASFKVSIGATANSTGIGSQGTTASSTVTNGGSTANISTQAGALAAVNVLAVSVSLLGNAQAVVGRGENQFNYAINLAQSQLTNLTSAEATIRDADLAAQAANLTKAQILLQAGVAALAQANSAPQAVLSLLKG